MKDRMVLAWTLVAIVLGGCGEDPSPGQRRAVLDRAYQSGIEQARRDIQAGQAVLFVEEVHTRGPLRIDRDTGLPLREAALLCGTDVDGEAYRMGIAGYQAEIARALAAGELRRSALADKVPDETALRARFEREAAVVIDAPTGNLDTPTGARIEWRTAGRNATFTAFGLFDPASGDRSTLPFNARPLRILWDHDGTTLVGLGTDGSLAAVDIPTGHWIAVYPGR